MRRGGRAGRLAAALLVGTALAAAAPGVAAGAFPEQLILDAHGPTEAPPSTTSQTPLVAGAAYDVMVQGTFSTVRPKRWTAPFLVVCGDPLALPLFPSSGVANGPTGKDAAMVFALPSRPPGSCPRTTLPRTHKRLLMNVGPAGAFVPVTPASGAPTTPAADHTYTYRVTGQGTPLSVRLNDVPVFDNYGVLHVTIAEPGAPPPDATPPASGTLAGGASGGTTGSRACSSRRFFTIRLGRRLNVRTAAVSIEGTRVPVRYGAVVTARIDLRRRTRQEVRVRTRVTTRAGRTIVRTRTYHPCIARVVRAV